MGKGVVVTCEWWSLGGDRRLEGGVSKKGTEVGGFELIGIVFLVCDCVCV